MGSFDNPGGWAGQPHYSLKDLAKLDDKVEAHLDGLRIAGDAGWELCQEELSWQEPGEVFAAGVLAYESGIEERIEHVLDVAVQEVELSRGLISALGWLAFERAKPWIERLITCDDPARRRIGIAAASAHRQAGWSGDDPNQWIQSRWLFDAIHHDDLPLRARAIRAAGELGRTDLLATITRHLDDEHDDCRFWSAWSCAMLGDARATPRLQKFATEILTSPYTDRAADLATRCLPHADAVAWQEELITTPELRRIAAKVAGAIGDPVTMGWLLEIMEDDDRPDCHRVAGEAFSMITGVDLAYDDLDRDEPDGFEPGPTEDEDDENVEMDADEDLPWPDPDAVNARWASLKGNLAAGTRYLLGRPVNDPGGLTGALRSGTQRQRAAAAIEMALQRPGRPIFNVRRRGDRQIATLGLDATARN